MNKISSYFSLESDVSIQFKIVKWPQKTRLSLHLVVSQERAHQKPGYSDRPGNAGNRTLHLHAL